MKDSAILFFTVIFFFAAGCKSGINHPPASGHYGLSVVSLETWNRPLLTGKPLNIISDIIINYSDTATKRSLKKIILSLSKESDLTDVPFPLYRFARIVRAAGQDNCNTYRIPGLVTTNSGTLIAVYDNRYNSSKDLQENIDIGMSRSTDGGETWEPMKVIMDMVADLIKEAR